jgi:hypothetical protein
MGELDVSPVRFRVHAAPTSRVGVTGSSGAKVILVPVPGGQGPQGAPGNASPVYNETPSGVRDGINTVFVTINTFLPGSTAVYLNGLRETPGDCYVESPPAMIVFDEPPSSADKIRVDYLIQ